MHRHWTLCLEIILRYNVITRSNVINDDLLYGLSLKY